MAFTLLLLCGFLASFCVGLRFDLRRRKLSLGLTQGWKLTTVLDVVGVNSVFGLAAVLLLASPRLPPTSGGLLTPATFGLICCVWCLLFLWAEGRRQVQLQRPAGIVAGECGILLGLSYLLVIWLFPQVAGASSSLHHTFVFFRAFLPIVAGAVLLALVVPPFVRGREEHRILDRIAAQGEFVQTEWADSTPECPFPEKWSMVDAQSAELEVLGFLESLVMTAKPDLIVETGTFIGHSAIKMAEGLRKNGFGRIITIEHNPAVFAKAKENIDASGLGRWIEYRNASSLETTINGVIDILYCDSDLHIREQEIRRFLPQIKPRGLVLVHDASSGFKVVRESALKLEREGLLSVVLLSTPRGLVVAQKREGRS
ncbi:MAG TPA: class I SAM-dependent methyltransferase [Candidatus Angelobacter sp.]